MKNSIYDLKNVNALYTMRAKQVLRRNDSEGTIKEFQAFKDQTLKALDF